MRLSLRVALIACVFTSVLAVKQEDFKKCEQSGFCRRQRAFAELSTKIPNFRSPYELLSTDLKISATEGIVSGILLDTERKIEFLTLLEFVQDGTSVRMRIKERTPLKPRYEKTSDFGLDRTPKLAPAKLVSSNAKDGVYILSFGQSNINTAKISSRPFSVEFRVGKELAMVFNGRGKLYYEHLRERENAIASEIQDQEDKPADGIVVEAEVQQSDEEKEITRLREELKHDLWEESFGTHRDSKPNGPTSIGLDIEFPGSNILYGLPEHASSLNLRTTRGQNAHYSEPYRLYNFDVFEFIMDSPMALYGSIPFTVSQKPGLACGAFWLNSAEMWVDIEKNDDKNKKTSNLHWMAESGIIDVFFFMGPSQKTVLKQYVDLTGKPAIPQLFAIAYHQCRWNYIDETDVLEVEGNFDKHDIPVDVIWLDIEHTDGKKYFTWDKSKFPNPIKMLNTLASHGRKMVNIVDPHIKFDGNYYIFAEAKTKGLLVKDSSGNKEFEGWCWPGSSVWIDYTNPEAREFWAEKFALDQYKDTTESLYIWNDMNEPSIFNGPEITMNKDAIHYGNVEHREVHNIYGMLLHRSTFEGLMLRGKNNDRPFILSRSFFAGSQRYGAIWTGDNMATWEQLAGTSPMLLSLGLAGMPFVGSDVAGFFGNPEPELLIRWYQTASYQPFFRAHAHIDSKRREPWLFGESNTKIIRDIIKNRYKLMPYIYSLFVEAHLTGTPVMRSISLEYPNLEEFWEVDDQFLLGDALLVKPVVQQGISSTVVKLPKTSIWYDYETYAVVNPSSSGELKVDTPLEKLPVFLRGGTILTTRNRIRRASILALHDPFTLTISLDSKGEASTKFYVDDGKSFDHKQGDYILTELKFKDNTLTSKEIRGVFENEGAGSTDRVDRLGSRVERIIIVGYKGKKTVTVKVGDRKVETNTLQNALVLKDPKLWIGKEWVLNIS